MKTKKDGSPDMRFAENRNTRDRKQRRAILLAILLGALFACAIVTFLTRPRVANEYIFDEVKQDYIDTQAPESFYEHIKMATPTPSPRACYQNIDKIRCIGEDLGYDNDVIKTMIRIARAESTFRSDAKNPSSTASGLFQIIYSTWNSNNCQGNAINVEDNIKCAYKIYSKRGFQPWASSASSWLAKR